MEPKPTLWEFNPKPKQTNGIVSVERTEKVSFSSPTRQSIEATEDYTVKKVINTQEGTIEKVPVNDNDIANKKYVDDNTSVSLTTDEYTGADCTGSNGQANRTLDVGVIPSMIFVNNSYYHNTVNYTLSGTTITFLNIIFDSHPISVIS